MRLLRGLSYTFMFQAYAPTRMLMHDLLPAHTLPIGFLFTRYHEMLAQLERLQRDHDAALTRLRKVLEWMQLQVKASSHCTVARTIQNTVHLNNLVLQVQHVVALF